jgi:hypothetical protein
MTEPTGSITLVKITDDVEYFMRVDHQFVGLVDDIVKSLGLSHFRVVTDKK